MDLEQVLVNYIENNQLEDQQEDQNQLSIQQSQQSFTLTKVTSVLSIQQNNQMSLKINDIIALYKQIDSKLFAHQIQEFILAEKTEFSDIMEVVNQRIVLYRNSNSTILQAFLRSNNKLIVLKYFITQNQEMLTKKMDEYIIHHKVNKIYPQQSIELILPVGINKGLNFYLTSCIERAEITLYDYYQQNQKIQQEEVDLIFQQLIQQVINLHQINIAHRDIKPQNIFYVQEKGWLLSDFGESTEYINVEDVYDVRGTVYFLQSKIKKYLKIGKCKQNLLSNDLYALVVSITMIKKQNYIQEIELEIYQQNDKLINQLLEITQLEDLITFQQKLFFGNKQDYKPLFNKKSYQQINQNQFHLNKFIITSWLHLYQYFISQQSHEFLVPQILELIKKQDQIILQDYYLKNLLLNMKINLNLQDINIIPVTSNIKKYHRLSLGDKYFCIKQLFYQGYSETTIYLAHDFLKNNYSQEVHMTLIESYFRAQIFEQFESQLEKFIEGLLFDYLSTELQIKFFWYLQKINSLGMTQKFYIDFNIDQQLLQRTFNIIKKETVLEKIDK